MKILIISRPDSTAAGIAAYNLHFSLLRKKYSSYLLVEYDSKYTADHYVYSYNSFFARIIKKLFKRILNRTLYKVKSVKQDKKYNVHGLNERNINTTVKKIINRVKIKPDVIFIFFPQGFVNSKLVNDLYSNFKVPIYWYLMDMAPMTGGCHFAWDCKGFIEDCGNCPGIFSKDPHDITFKNLEFKKRNLLNVDLRLIVGADWLIDKARISSLFKKLTIKKIMLPVNEEIFKPGDKISARRMLNLPIDKKVFFFGSQSLRDPRKGIDKILEALKFLDDKNEFDQIRDKIFFIYAGHHPEFVNNKLIVDNKYLGMLTNDQELATAYQASDFLISASLQDTGPYMLIEAISSGIPVISFNMGLAYEFVKTGETGYNAKLSDIADLARGIIYAANLDEKEYTRLSQNCIAFANSKLTRVKQLEKIEELLCEIS